MARPANRYLKETSNLEDNKHEQYLCIGKYLRLSVDSDYTGSDSIENQRILINDYLTRFLNIAYEEEYVDNGLSGTKFERPGFKKLIQDVKSGLINCIIVKDLSRFGREYLEVGNYIEKVFPFMNVRFISINDNYDSFNPYCNKELLCLSLKNLTHEIYAKDISKKVSSTYKTKQSNGEFYRTSKVPYGYLYDTNKKSYVIDVETAPIVKDIFLKYSQGTSKSSICKYLMRKNVATPREYNSTKNIYNIDNSTKKIWYAKTIDVILRNEIYIGTVNRHKTETKFFKDMKRTKISKEEWINIENIVEPIVNRELFFKVQEILTKTAEKHLNSYKAYTPISRNDYSEYNAFKGKIFCGDCGSPMERLTKYHQINKTIKSSKVFKCSANKHLPELCNTKCIEEKTLYQLIQNTICLHIKLVNDWKQIIESDIKYSFSFKLDKIEKEKSKIQKSKEKLQYDYLEIYNKYSDKEISQSDFLFNRNKYLEECKIYDEKIVNINCKEKRLLQYQKAFKEIFSLWLSYNENKNLTNEIVNTFVERIEVFKDNRLDIKFKYNDYFLLLKNYMQEGLL